MKKSSNDGVRTHEDCSRRLLNLVLVWYDKVSFLKPPSLTTRTRYFLPIIPVQNIYLNLISQANGFQVVCIASTPQQQEG